VHLIVGLGNPGRPYHKTRHNAGFMLIDRIAQGVGEKVERLNGRSLVCTASFAGKDVTLAKPQTYMNLSGCAVQELVKRGNFDLSRCIVVYDEVSLPLGTTRFRASGGAGGHKGMRSVLQALGTEQIARLRIGISGDAAVDDLTRFVLGRFKRSELVVLEGVLDRCYSALEVFLEEGIDRAMSLYN